MGKTQKKRAMRRHNPVRVPDSHLQHGLATAAASTSSVKRDAVLPVIEKVCAVIFCGNRGDIDGILRSWGAQWCKKGYGLVQPFRISFRMTRVRGDCYKGRTSLALSSPDWEMSRRKWLLKLQEH